jgi:hypothetical protein
MTKSDNPNDDGTDDAKSRAFRRIRAEFRRELLGDAVPSPSDKTMIEQAALASMRASAMRDAIVAGERVEDDDFVRMSNALVRIMNAFRGRAAGTKQAARPQSFEERMKARDQKHNKVFDENDF